MEQQNTIWFDENYERLALRKIVLKQQSHNFNNYSNKTIAI